MRGQSLGSVSYVSKTDKYQACFYDSICNKGLHLGFYNSREEAQNVVDDYVFDFYNKNKILLPKYISLELKNNNYVFNVIICKKVYQVSRSKSLKEVINARVNFISNLI